METSSFLQKLKQRSKEFLAELNDYEQVQQHDGDDGDDEEVAAMVSNVMGVVRVFRAAYAQVQLAHSPFEEEAVRAADRAAVAQLRRLSDLKRTWRDKKTKTKTDHVEDGRLQAQVHERQLLLRTYELVLNRLESEIRSKDGQVESVKAQIAEVKHGNRLLEKRLRTIDTSPTLSVELFVQCVRRASLEAQLFTATLLSLMSDSSWDIPSAASSIDPHARFAKEIHHKYAFESYVCLGMFGGFGNDDSYVNGGISSIHDPEKYRLNCFMEYEDMAKSEDPSPFLDCSFGKFCHRKYLQIVHARMEESFFGNLEQRSLVLEGRHPRTHFYESFVKLAKAVWLVHKLGCSFDPAASVFQVGRGTDFSTLLMESVVPGWKIQRGRPKVSFTVMPGFRLPKALIQCQVYLEAENRS